MDKKIDYIILGYAYFYRNERIVQTDNEMYKSGDGTQYYLHVLKKIYRTVSEQTMLDNLTIKRLPKPKTWPKFSNEDKLDCSWGKEWKKIEKINFIRWNGENWEYCCENLGHKYDFISENKFRKINVIK
jgi:hypothetical protein